MFLRDLINGIYIKGKEIMNFQKFKSQEEKAAAELQICMYEKEMQDAEYAVQGKVNPTADIRREGNAIIKTCYK